MSAYQNHEPIPTGLDTESIQVAIVDFNEDFGDEALAASVRYLKAGEYVITVEHEVAVDDGAQARGPIGVIGFMDLEAFTAWHEEIRKVAADGTGLVEYIETLAGQYVMVQQVGRGDWVTGFVIVEGRQNKARSLARSLKRLAAWVETSTLDFAPHTGVSVHTEPGDLSLFVNERDPQAGVEQAKTLVRELGLISQDDRPVERGSVRHYQGKFGFKQVILFGTAPVFKAAGL